MTARYIVGDSLTVTRTLPDHSVDFLMTSPPFLALRSYLPADHPDKHREIGSEPDPAAFLDTMLALSAEWRRVLTPHGSICVELGDTYAGSERGGEGFKDGDHVKRALSPMPPRNLTSGWPRAKSLTLIPEAYRFALVYGVNPHTGQPSPAGRWQARNVIRWVRPNPPVGALGKKWRPATSELVVACPDDDKRYWDDVATRVEASPNTHKRLANGDGARYDLPSQQRDGNWSTLEQNDDANPAGAPLLDWWRIVPKGYEGAHYAVYPPELCTAPIDAMCPRRVCRTCGRPSERETKGDGGNMERDELKAERGQNQRNPRTNPADRVANITTTGWSTCGCPGTDGIRLDGFHDGPGWRSGIVFDPFAGTGTTLAVATGMGRDAIGIDLDPRNADLALDRVGPLLLTVEHHREAVA